MLAALAMAARYASAPPWIRLRYAYGASWSGSGPRLAARDGSAGCARPPRSPPALLVVTGASWAITAAAAGPIQAAGNQAHPIAGGGSSSGAPVVKGTRAACNGSGAPIGQSGSPSATASSSCKAGSASASPSVSASPSPSGTSSPTGSPTPVAVAFAEPVGEFHGHQHAEPEPVAHRFRGNRPGDPVTARTARQSARVGGR